MSKMVPPQGHYQTVEMEKYKNRSSKWHVIKDKTVGFREGRIQKEKEASPGPNTYNASDVFFKTQINGSMKMQSFSKMKGKSFIDFCVKQHSIAPGVGQYKVEQGEKHTGRSLFLRTKRF